MKMKVSLIVMITDWEWFPFGLPVSNLPRGFMEKNQLDFQVLQDHFRFQEVEKIFCFLLEQNHVEKVG